MTSSALQSRKWQLIGMSHWCRSALCGHPLPALTDNWTHDAASRHTIAPISHTRPSPRSRSYYSFPFPLRVEGWVIMSNYHAWKPSDAAIPSRTTLDELIAPPEVTPAGGQGVPLPITPTPLSTIQASLSPFSADLLLKSPGYATGAA